MVTGTSQPDRDWLAAVSRARDGDREAFAALVRQFSPFVFQVAHSVLWNVQDAEDVAQETFLKAYANLNGLREPRAFIGWLGRIARNLAQNQQRRRRSHPESELTALEAETISHITDPPAESLLAGEARATMEAAIWALPEHYRTALLLRVKSGLSYEEIAAVLEVPVGTVRSRIHSARKSLAAALEGDPDSRRSG